MSTDLMAQCEQSFYEELYHDPDGRRSIVRDRVSGRIFYEKTLTIYDIQVYAFLKDHPDIHVPRVHSFYEQDGGLIVTEELISGYTLDYMLENDMLSDDEKKNILIQICDGLSFLHSARPQIIHRDLKLQNVMVTDGGVAKIIDYDAAKVFRPEETKDTILIGTKGSAAPEQYGFGKCDERTDIYGLGVMIREMFPDDPEMLQIAAKATMLEPEHRFQHVEQIRRRLERQKFINVPGFRSRTPWKMVPAGAFYAFLLYFFFTFEAQENGKPLTGFLLWLNRICITAIPLCIVDLFTGWSGFWKRVRRAFPLKKGKNIIAAVAVYAALSFLIVFFWAAVCVIAENIF